MAKDAQDLWWGLYQENLNHARHHEQQRTAVTGYFAAVAAGILGIVSLDKCVTQSDWPLLVLLFILGLFGSVLTLKQYERYTHHMERARQYRNALEASVPDSRLEDLKRAADANADTLHPMLSRWKLVKFWMSLHLLSSVLALVLLSGGLLGILPCRP
jgi:hypothetical protein